MKKGLVYLIGSIIMIFIMLIGLQFGMTNIGGNKGSTNIANQEIIQENKKQDLNKFLELYKSGKLTKINIINGTELIGLEKVKEETKSNGLLFGKDVKYEFFIEHNSFKPIDSSLEDLGISLTGSTSINAVYEEKSNLKKILVESVLPIILIIILIGIFFRFFGPKGGGFPFGAQAGKLRKKADVKTTFEDAAGMDEAKAELKEIVDYLKNPTKYTKVGARIPKGVLLYGPPGSGKTLLARAIAGQAEVPFFSASGSEFMEMLVGMGAAKVRDLFKKAQEASPSIIFIDEIDSIGKKRGGGYTGGHQEQEQTLNQILTEMDGFDKDTKIIVVAATNRPEILDPALLRPGRFDRKVYVGRPTIEERLEILKVHSKDKSFEDGVDLNIIAKRTSGFVGADLANIMNEAALKVAREEREKLSMDDLEYALEKFVMGPEKKIKSIKDKEKKIITYHELGHAVTAYNLENCETVEKISIVSRGRALGVTWIMPEEDRHLFSKAQFLDEIVSMLGGRASEEIFFGENDITTGASNDLERASKYASDMIMKYGMDPELGPVMYYDGDTSEYIPFKPFSEKTSQLIDEKIKGILNDGYKRAKDIINTNQDIINVLAEILLEKEYLGKEEFEQYMTDISKAKEALQKLKEKKENDKIEKERIENESNIKS